MTLPGERWKDFALCAALTGYFLIFTQGVLGVHFALDDMMNMGVLWEFKPKRLLLANFMPWHGYYRPMAAFFYLPLHYAFGLNPMPYHLVIQVFLLVATLMVYWFARRLGCDRIVAALAGAVVAYHAGLANLYYNSAFIYDVLCGFFFLASFLYYTTVRERGRPARPREIAAFLALYLAALNSKEMAVTLPGVLLVYEWQYLRRARSSGLIDLVPWIKGPGRLLLAASLLDLLSIRGTLFGPNALANATGYGVVISWERLLKFQKAYLGDILFRWGRTDETFLIVAWFLVTWLAWRRKRPVLRFCWFWMLLTPLPIEFLEGRAAACLYIPLMGWAVFAAVVFRDLIGAIANFLAGEPLLRFAGSRAIATVLTLAGLYLLFFTNYDYKRRYINKSMADLGEITWNVIQQLRAMNPKVRPNSKVVFLDSPYEGWDMLFIAELWFRDRSLQVRLQPKNPLPPEDLARAEHIFTFDHGKLVQVR